MRLRGLGSTLGVLRTLLNFADIMDRQGVPTITPSNLYLLNLSTTPPALPPLFLYYEMSPTFSNIPEHNCGLHLHGTGCGERPAAGLSFAAFRGLAPKSMDILSIPGGF